MNPKDAMYGDITFAVMYMIFRWMYMKNKKLSLIPKVI